MGTALSVLRDNAKRYADLDSVTTGPVSTAAWATFLNAAYEELWSVVSGCFGEHFLTSADFTLSGATNTFALPTGFHHARGLDRNPDAKPPQPVRPFTWDERNTQCERSYVLRGGVLEIRPKSLAPGDYRLWYYDGPQTLALDADEISDQVDRWHDFVEMRAAQYALDKMEQDSTFIERRLAEYIVNRIQPAARLRDAGGPPRAVRTKDDHLADPWHARWGAV